MKLVILLKSWTPEARAAALLKRRANRMVRGGVPVLKRTVPAFRDALEEYAATSNYSINARLRGRKARELWHEFLTNPDQDAHIQAQLDRYFEQVPPTTRSLTVFRGTGVKHNRLDYGDLDGKVVHDPGYASASRIKGPARHFSHAAARGKNGGVILKIHVPPGAKVLDVSHYKGNKSEKEILFPRGSNFQIVGKGRLRRSREERLPYMEYDAVYVGP